MPDQAHICAVFVIKITDIFSKIRPVCGDMETGLLPVSAQCYRAGVETKAKQPKEIPTRVGI